MAKEKKIFGTFDPYEFPGNWKEKPSKTFGIHMANYSLIKALLTYGGFDEYHFYKNAKTDAKSFADFRDGLGLPAGRAAKMKLKYLAELAGPAAAVKYTVFHHCDPRARDFYYARETFFGQNPFPVSAMVHTISSSLAYEDFMENILSPTRSCDVIICPSEALKTAVKKYFSVISEFLQESGRAAFSYRGRFEVVPLGVDASVFKPRDKKELRTRLKLPPASTIVLFLGRLTPANKMDIHPLLQAFKIALERSNNKNALLLVVGKEQMAHYVSGLERTARELGLGGQVMIRSDFSNHDVPLYYSAADIFVSPSDNIQETFGLTPIEAMASGLPVVISDWDGYKEAVDHGRSGFKVPTYWADCNQTEELFDLMRSVLYSLLYFAQSVAVDVKQYAHYLSLLIDDAGLRERMGALAREEVLKRYDWKVVIPQLEALWTKLKAEAGTDDLAKQGRAFARVPYFELFDHYATKIIEENDQLKISEYGENKLKDLRNLRVLEAMAEKLDSKLIGSILANLKNWTALKAIYDREKSYHREKVLYHVMYLLKHNYLVLKT